jgi:hypothetical protein
VQDDLDDWRAESATMHQVYSNAIFCVAATAAPDGNTGLFFDRDLETLKPIETEITWPPTSFDMDATTTPASTYWLGAITVSRILAIEQAPLNQRAWVRLFTTVCTHAYFTSGSTRALLIPESPALRQGNAILGVSRVLHQRDTSGWPSERSTSSLLRRRSGAESIIRSISKRQ